MSEESIKIEQSSVSVGIGRSLPAPKSRKIFFSKGVDQSSIEAVSKEIIFINEDDRYLEKLYKLDDLDYKAKPITIYIDSYGGKVYQMFGLISIMEKSVTPIHTICTGVAMSCGFMILIYGHRRFCYEHSTPLYHQVGGGAIGKVEDLEQTIERLKKTQNKWEELTIRKTKISKDMLDKNRREKIDWYMTAEEAKQLGVIDEVI